MSHSPWIYEMLAHLKSKQPFKSLILSQVECEANNVKRTPYYARDSLKGNIWNDPHFYQAMISLFDLWNIFEFLSTLGILNNISWKQI